MPWLRNNGARIVLAALGLVLIVLAMTHPSVYEEKAEVNAEQEAMPALYAGDVLEQTLTADEMLTQLSLRVDQVKDAKALTLRVSLLKAEDTAAEAEFPLQKVRTKGRLMLEPPQPLAAGTYTLRIAAEGSGSVVLCGDVQQQAVINGETGDMGCYVRMVYSVRRYGVPAAFGGMLLVLLALTPGGGKEKRHA